MCIMHDGARMFNTTFAAIGVEIELNKEFSKARTDRPTIITCTDKRYTQLFGVSKFQQQK